MSYPGFNLTPKQRAFANAYIETGSAPEAAMRAYDCSNRNSARVMAHRNLNNAKIQAYLSFQVTDKVMLDKAIETLFRQFHATKFMKAGNKVMQVPDNMASLKALQLYFKLFMEFSANTPEMTEQEEQEVEDSYWEMRYMHENGGRKPTPDELRRYREAIDVVPEECKSGYSAKRKG